MNSLLINLLGVLTVSLAWGFGGPASYYVTRNLTSSQATFGRCGIAFLGLLPFLLKDGIKLIPHLSSRARLLIMASGLTLGVHFYCFVSGVAYASLSTAVMLVAVEPVLILSVGVIAFKEKLTLESLIAIGFCVFGISVMSILPHLGSLDGAHSTRGLGDVAAVAAILTYAVYYGLNRSFKNEEATLTALIPNPLRRGFTLASLIYFFAASITGLLMLILSPHEPMPEQAPTLRTVVGLIALGFIPTILGHTLSQIVSRRAHPIWVSLMSPGETVMSLFIGVLFLNQTLSTYEIWGGLLIALGVGIAIYGESKSA